MALSPVRGWELVSFGCVPQAHAQACISRSHCGLINKFVRSEADPIHPLAINEDIERLVLNGAEANLCVLREIIA